MRNTPYKYRNLSFRAFANPSGVNELDPNLTINGTTVEPTFRYKGGDADGTDIDPWSYGETLTLQAGAVPTYNDGSPGLGVNDDSVKFNNGGYYQAGNTTAGQVATEDFVVEAVFKYDAAATDAIAGTRSTGVGWSLYTTGQIKMNLKDVDSEATVVSNMLIDGAWYHGILFLDRSGSGQWYIDGVASGAAVDISGESGTLSSGLAMCFGSRAAGSLAYNSNVSYFAMWKGAAWLDTHLQAAVAAERFARFNGCARANKANGTALASVKTRAFNAYLRKQEGANVKLYNVGSEWMRMESLDDSNGVNVKGYLAEPQIENLIDESEDFSAWTKLVAGDVVTDDAILCPDGRTAASSLVADNTNDAHGIWVGPTLTAFTHAYSIYAKPGDRDWLYLRDATVADCTCYFDIANGTVGTAGAGAVGYIEGPFFGGFYRCVIVFMGTNAAHGLRVYTADADGDFAITGDGVTVNTYLWGAQVEKNDYMSSPILTDGATATRLKDQDRSIGDDGNVANNGRGFMRFNVLAADCDLAADAALVTLSDGGAAADQIAVTLAAAGDAVTVTTAATAGNAGSATVAVDIADGAEHEIRVRWETNYLNIAVDGVWGTADTSVDIPDDLDRVDLAQDRSAASQAQCIVSNFRIHSAVRGG